MNSSASEHTQVIHPVEIDTPLLNPHKGWVYIDHAIPGEIDAGKSVARVKDGTVYQWYTGVAVLSTWGIVEAEENRYDWSLVDQSINYWASQGKAIHLRFSTEQFGPYPGCPDWLYRMGVPRHQGGEGYYYPDYSHPLYLNHLQRFLAVFADRFCSDPRIETIDLRAYGSWGEWHSGAPYNTLEERLHTLHGLIDAWRVANRERKFLNLSVSWEWQTHDNTGIPVLPPGYSHNELYAPTYADYRRGSAFDYALPFPDISIRRDGVAGCIIQQYDGRLIANFFAQYRKPIFTEYFGGPSFHVASIPADERTTDKMRPWLENALDDILNQHPNFSSPHGWGSFGGATEYYNDYPDLVLKGHKLMGYRFVLTKAVYPQAVAPGDVLNVQHTWQNRALGRCYKRYPLALYLLQDKKVVWQGIDANFDQTNFVAGESYTLTSQFQLPQTLPEGDYEVRLAMVNTTGEPAIQLAISGGDALKRYLLGPLRVAASASASESITVTTTRSATIRKDARCRFVTTDEFEPNSAYLITFRYQVTAAPIHDLDTDQPGYWRFYVQGADQRLLNEARWFDLANQPKAMKTQLVTTGESTGYHAFWEAVGGGAIDVDQVQIDRLPLESVTKVLTVPNDNHHVILAPDARFYEKWRIVARRDRSSLNLPNDCYDFLSTNPDTLPLQPDSVYTVWFDGALHPQNWEMDMLGSMEIAATGAFGDYAYLDVRNGLNAEAQTGVRFRWVQRHTTNPERKCYTFRTGLGSGWRLVWGLKNGGQCTLANIYIIQEATHA